MTSVRLVLHFNLHVLAFALWWGAKLRDKLDLRGRLLTSTVHYKAVSVLVHANAQT